MASRPVIERRKEEYAQALEKCSILLVAVGFPSASEKFGLYARKLRKNPSLKEIRKICRSVRSCYAGTMGGMTEAYATHADGSVDREMSHAYEVALQEVWKYSFPLRWLI
ncbi:hypothetical protein [Rathayibacter toxicus]|uniref:hypothetical protein n=1 Tax=Rathayibacter toxicus TaxID=145458 RepID=UPI001C04BAB9|nr:hypothetical protein [Rathayibacter toxicus]QWL29790.1 hypothetical protein E2R34_02830 [Rathayibacter toxicus]QWL31894.1 hypothetical protein E2R35_02905 [Rathayibacter toxicus]QWL33987.1 hypothetical protein E2R36_02905 [Rathayibacter toxicus]QWL36119.1 hypothetical protein E2R37_02900 [Rathayibacter toxicus]QWL38210.1 hypothetical protein E2R38_02900 [Rathayibacter toxicus]